MHSARPLPNLVLGPTALVLFVLLAPSSWASPIFTGISAPIPDATISVDALSDDGSTAVGSFRSTGGEGGPEIAFLFRLGEGSLAFAPPPAPGAPPGIFGAEATGVSQDGSIIVGDTSTGDGYRWTADTGLLLFGPGNRPEGVSPDGRIIVGDTDEEEVAYRFSLDGGLELLGLPSGFDGSTAFAASTDGSVVVGSAVGAFPLREAVLWDAAGRPRLLGAATTTANDVSADGTVVVGLNETTSNSLGDRAFRWDSQTGLATALQPLSPTAPKSEANAVSASGNRIVGVSGGQAVVWDELGTVRLLADVLSEDFGLGVALAGWSLRKAVDVSADGRTITGSGTNPLGVSQAWIAVLGSIDFFWSGSCGNGNWHADCPDSNWVDLDLRSPASESPGGRPNQTATIALADVVIQDRAVGLAALSADGSLRVLAPLTLQQDSDIAALTLGSDLKTDGKLRLLGASTWNSGQITGELAGVQDRTSGLVIDPGSTFALSPTDKTLATNLEVKGGVRHIGGTLTVGNSAQLIVRPNALYDITDGGIVFTSGSLASGSAIFNEGTFQMTAPDLGEPPGSGEVMIDAPFVNDGSVRVETGTLTFLADNLHRGGTIFVAEGANLKLLNGPTRVTGNVEAFGSGNVAVTGGSLIVEAGAAAEFRLSGLRGLRITDGALLDLDGTLTNTRHATLEWGSIKGGRRVGDSITGGFVNAPGATLTILEGPQGSSRAVRGFLRNQGHIFQNGTPLVIEDGAIVNAPGGLFEVFAPSSFDVGNLLSSPSATGQFENSGGTFLASGRTSDSIDVAVPFHQSAGGTVKIDGTTLELGQGGQHTGSGSFELENFGSLILEGTHRFDGDFRISGTGGVGGRATIEVAGGRLIFDLADTVGGNFLRSGFPDIRAETGEIVNEGSLRLGGSTRGGTFSDAGASFGFRNRGGTLYLGSARFEDSVLTNSDGGTIIITAINTFTGSTLLNELGSVVRFSGNGSIGSKVDEPRQGLFINRGGEVVSGVGVTTFASIGVPFHFLSGTVRSENFLVFEAGALSKGTGSYEIAPGATIWLNDKGFDYEGAYSVTGGGTFGIVNRADLIVHSGTFTLDLRDAGKAIFNGFQAGGFLGGTDPSSAGKLINLGNAEWKGGSLTGFINEELARLTILEGTSKLARRGVENRGIVDHTLDARVILESGATYFNAGTYDLHGLLTAEDTTSKFLNTGAISKEAGTFRLAEPGVERTFSGVFDNKGTVEVAQGSKLFLTGEVVQLKDSLILDDVLLGGTWIAQNESLISLGDGSVLVDRSAAGVVVVLHGSGRLSVIPTSPDSNGIDFTNGGSFELRSENIFNTSGDFTNNGALLVDETSRLNVNGEFEANSGSLTRILAGGELISLAYDNNSGSRFRGSGTIDTLRFDNRGELIPGSSPGILEITGDYNQLPEGLLFMELGGTGPGSEHDQLFVGGTATFELGSRILVDLIDLADPEGGANPFAPDSGDFFDLLVAGQILFAGGGPLLDSFTLPGLREGLFFEAGLLLAQNQTDILRLSVAGELVSAPEPSLLILVGLGLLASSLRRRSARS